MYKIIILSIAIFLASCKNPASSPTFTLSGSCNCYENLLYGGKATTGDYEAEFGISGSFSFPEMPYSTSSIVIKYYILNAYGMYRYITSEVEEVKEGYNYTSYWGSCK